MYAQNIERVPIAPALRTSCAERYARKAARNHKSDSINCTRPEDRRSESRIVRNRIRRQQEMKKNFMLLSMTICLIIVCSFTLSTFRANAKSKAAASYKYYKSIVVSNNDTLWSIAEKYMNEDHYASLTDYINEIKSINSLSGDSICYGEVFFFFFFFFFLIE